MYQTETASVKKEILKRLSKVGFADMKSVASLVARRDIKKVEKAYRGLIKSRPMLRKVTTIENNMIRLINDGIINVSTCA